MVLSTEKDLVQPIHGTLTDTKTQSLSGLESTGNEEVNTFPKYPGLKPHYQMSLRHI